MTESSYSAEVVYEEATNQRYLELCRDKSLRYAAITAAISTSHRWTQAGSTNNAGALSGPLTGRVQLAHVAEMFASSHFYVGPVRIDEEGLNVVSWVADAAKTFFSDETDAYELSSDVVLRKTLISQGNQIVDAVDEWVPGAIFAGSPFTDERLCLVPEPPGALAAPPVDLPPAPPPPPSEVATPGSAIAPTIPTPRESETGPKPKRLRAERAVLARLAAPRTDGLSAVLETLQPDQYDLVTRPAEEPLLIQGHAGTGKTIMAAHRAAYLTNPDRATGSVGRVLLIGPSAQYARHVQDVLRALDPQQSVAVTGLAAWMHGLTGPTAISDESPPSPDDVTGAINDLCLRVVALLGLTDHNVGAGRVTPDTLSRVYECVRANKVGRHLVTRSSTMSAWAKALPPYVHAAQMRRYQPLLAACALSIRPPTRKQTYAHIVVDEAQDLTPLEWQLLGIVNAGQGWTIVGDSNQRSNDAAVASWRLVSSALGLNEADGRCEPIELVRGYRSTKAIMRYAGRLLPRGRRTVDSLQVDGPAPDVRRSSQAALATQTILAAEGLKVRLATGTVAVIAIAPGRFSVALKKAGWHPMRGRSNAWAKGRQELLLFSPEDARGLEFDGVVVVEPADFPLAKKADGPLYTSLTRANRELCVVHARPLPKALQGPPRPPSRKPRSASVGSPTVEGSTLQRTSVTVFRDA